jgi:hypothetical protein
MVGRSLFHPFLEYLTMKNLMIASAMLLSSAVSFAEVPRCWTDETLAIVDGSFLVSFSSDTTSKEELMTILRGVKGKYVTPSQYPMIFTDYLVIPVDAKDDGYGQNKLSRAKLKAAVTAELSQIENIGDLTISCNRIMTAGGVPTPK